MYKFLIVLGTSIGYISPDYNVNECNVLLSVTIYIENLSLSVTNLAAL